MKTCIITGGNSGIGRSAAYQIAEKGLRVIIACRNLIAGEKTAEDIREKTGNSEVYARRVDLSLIEEVTLFTHSFTEEFGSLDILINNAADFDLGRKVPLITREGHEAQFATNHLAPFALVMGLMPLLQHSEDGRIINIASQGLMLYPRLNFDFDNIKGDKSYSPAKTYYQTKLAHLMFSLTLKEKLKETPISVYAVRVTNVKIDMARYDHISPILKLMYKIKSRFSITPDEMAKVYAELAVGPKREGFYYDEKMKEVPANQSVYDPAIRDRLWKMTEQMIQI